MNVSKRTVVIVMLVRWDRGQYSYRRELSSPGLLASPKSKKVKIEKEFLVAVFTCKKIKQYSQR